MKKFLSIFIFLLLVNIFIPAIYHQFYYSPNNNNNDIPKDEVPDYSNVQNNDIITLYNLETSSTEDITLIDFLIGSAACEMPSYYEAEAIKAQMIAAYSYYLYCYNNPTYLPSTYITFNESIMFGYASKTKLQEYWQMSFNDNYAKFLRCANEVINQVVTYDNEPALTTYYAVSCGMTQKSEDEWGMALPYLINVDSSFDGVSDNYLQMKTFTVQEMYDRLVSGFAGVELDIDTPDKWFGDIIYNDAGYVSLIPVNKSYIPGNEFRKILELPSACFMIFLEDDVFSIATKGYGHGVGLSQFGSNELSKQGKTYTEILNYYYPNTILKKM